jgi:hypothetical protein
LSNLALDTSALRQFKATRRANERPRIQLANGDFLEPRRQWAGGVGISDKTAGRMNLPTTYIANVAYVLHNASTEILAERVRQRNQPEPPKRRQARR